MKPMKKAECLCCGNRYFVMAETLPAGICLGEAFPSNCPICGAAAYAMLLKEERLVKIKK